MPESLESYRETLTNDVVLDGVVEYNWYVGCTPTAVAIVMGYWDRHGFDNLITGDTSYYSDDVKLAIASQEHFNSYYNPKEEAIFSNNIKADKSELGGAHQDNSIADFLHTSRSIYDVSFGVTQFAWEGIGVNGYTTHKGYEGFESTFKRWGNFTWNEIVTEINQGRPVIFSVDSDGDGRNDHNIVVIGYNQNTQEFAFQDGWERTEYIRWEPFNGMSDGDPWGVSGATFVRPPTTQTSNNLKTISIVSDGNGTPTSYKSELLSNGKFDSELLTTNSYLASSSVGLATPDGHTFYQLYDDGNGKAILYESLAYGNGTFSWRKFNTNSWFGDDTIGFATVDGKTFYQLYDDGSGTAAIYEAVLQSNSSFSWNLLNSDSGLNRSNTLDFATVDGETFYQLYDDGNGTAALYESILQGDGTFSWTLLDSDSGLSRSTTSHAMWQSQISAIDFSKTTPSFLPTEQINANVFPTEEETEVTEEENVIENSTTTDGNNAVEGTTENDLLDGDNNSNNLTGSSGNNILKGYGGDDNLVGGAGNDSLFGHGGSDRLNGSDPENRGANEYDVLGGGKGNDTFILGDEGGTYYIANGNRDYARINGGFVLGEDTIQLHGSKDNYRTEGNKLFVNDNELIAVFNNISNVDLDSSSFIFV